MGRRFLLLIILMGATLAGWAQNEEKLSVTTQMFLNELNGDITFERDIKAEKQLGLKPIDGAWRHKGKHPGRIYATPDTINGKAYIAAYLRLHNANDVSEVEEKGVILQESFINGLYTSLIPVDKINEVAAISNVKRINVSPLKKVFTNAARQKTNVYDVLTQSTDAISSGLTKKFDGSGVVLGVIDTGIDFAHIAFNDKNGNSRIKKAYVYDGRSAKEYSSITSTTLTDDNSEDHGTHTSTTAGGSSVIINGSNVTITDDHAAATYGGMAPGADLYLAGIKDLSSTYLDNAVKKMCDYADQQGKPLVVSNSWGSQLGPHDGTSDEADVYNSLFGSNHPNRIALFASSNDGGKSVDGEGGGYHVSGTASSNSPLRTIMRSATYIDTDAGYYYYGIIASAWARSTNVSSMSCKIYVLDSSTGAVKTSVVVNPTTSGVSVSGLGNYYSGTLYAYKNYLSSNKTQIMLYSNNGLTSKSYTQTTKDGEAYYKSKYTLAVEFYPSSGSSVIDVWGGTYCYFTNHLSTNGYTWTAGTDDGCYSDESTIDNVISIGAYVSKTNWTASSGTSYTMQSVYTMDDIADFSSWGTASGGPAGKMIPWITAPGARLAAGVNHNHTTSVDDYSYYGDDYSYDLVVNNSLYPYAMMEGTSMATPTAAGIVALWMQASLEENAQHKNLTVNDVKQIMKETAINDAYTTTGANASHFGNGKIDALAGIKYILGASAGPTIKATPTEVNFEGYAEQTYTQTVSVKGISLEGNISVEKSGDNAFTIDKTSITQNGGTAQADITITWSPTTTGTQTGVITLSSQNAETVTITITGTVIVPELIANTENVSLTTEAGLTATGKFTVLGANLKDNVTVTLNDANNVFSIDATTITKADTEEGKDINVTFSPTIVGNYTATVILSSPGADDVIVTLNGTATNPVPTLTASEQTLTFSTDINKDETKTVILSGRALSNDITITLTDDAGVFTVNPTTIAATEIANNPAINVTFNASEEDTYTGTLTISSEGVEDIVINLSATASDGGTASDPYLNIAKYSTIDDAGWNKSYVNNLYKYTEYKDDEVAWLTLPIYGAWVGTYYNSHPQKWIQSNVNNNYNKYAGNSWDSNLELLGSSFYFKQSSGDGSARVMGFNSKNNNTQETVTFYVTNTTAVKMLGLGQSKTSSRYPTTLKIFECTKNADGSVTASSTAIKNESNSATSGTFVLSATNLDATKIYKIETATYRSYICEIGFQTSLKTPELIADPEEIEFSTNVGTPITKTFDVLGSDLSGEVKVTLTDGNGVYSIDTETISIADVQEGKTVSITFIPTHAGTYSGTVTLSSPKAASVVVNLTGLANLIGDVNRDGLVNIADVTAMVDIVLGKDDEESYAFDHVAADLDGDNNITITDVTALVNIILSTSAE